MTTPQPPDPSPRPTSPAAPPALPDTQPAPVSDWAQRPDQSAADAVQHPRPSAAEAAQHAGPSTADAAQRPAFSDASPATAEWAQRPGPAADAVQHPLVSDAPGAAAGTGEAAVARAERPVRPWLIAGATGAVIGALVVGIMWAASSFVGGGGDDAAEDAAAACGVFARVPDTWTPDTVTEENTYQLGGAIALAQAAGKRDAGYRVLANQAQQLQQAVVTFDVQRVAQLVVDVRNTCDEL